MSEALDAVRPLSSVGRRPSADVRHVGLLLDPARLRLAHCRLAARLADEAGLRVTVLKGQARRPAPPSLELFGCRTGSIGARSMCRNIRRPTLPIWLSICAETKRLRREHFPEK
jgi:hypothetical protein